MSKGEAFCDRIYQRLLTTLLLKLPEVTVEGRTQVEGYICLHLKIPAQEIGCPHCGKSTQELHPNRLRLVAVKLITISPEEPSCIA